MRHSYCRRPSRGTHVEIVRATPEMTILPWAQRFGASFGCRELSSSHVRAHYIQILTHARAHIYSYIHKTGWEVGCYEMVRRLGVAGVSSPLQWSPGQTVRSIEGRGYTFLGGRHPTLSLPPLAYAVDDDPPCRATFRARPPPLISLAFRFCRHSSTSVAENSMEI